MNLNKFSLGGTAAIITSMGLIAGLNYGEHAKMAIIGGLLVIAIADNIADAFSLHVFKESESTQETEVFSVTFGNFFVRLLIALSFVALVWLLPANIVFYLTTFWGLLLLTVLSLYISQKKKTNRLKEILIHLGVAVLVIAVSKYLGFIITKYIS